MTDIDWKYERELDMKRQDLIDNAPRCPECDELVRCTTTMEDTDADGNRGRRETVCECDNCGAIS